MNTTLKTTLPDFVQSRIDFFIDDIIKSNDNGKALVLGKRPEKNDLVLQSNDYLSLADNPLIKERLKKAIDQTHDSIFMSGVFLQDESSKPSLEVQLAELVGFDSCLLSQSGWNANIVLLQTICSPGTNVYVDFFTHMSMWEGVRYANAKAIPFMHNNYKHLAKMIKKNGPGVILVDSIYSTSGTVAPLREIVEIAQETGCVLVVDESHSLGTHGPKGSGLVSELGLTDQVDFLTASLAKAFAYRAGAIWANNNATECMPFVGFPAIFSSTILPYELEALEETLHIIQNADDKRQRLHHNMKKVKNKLADIGLNIKSESQIIGLETGDPRNTEKVRDFLEERGVFGAVFCKPATPKNKNIIRLSLTSEVTDQDIDKIVSVCNQVMQHEELYFLSN